MNYQEQTFKWMLREITRLIDKSIRLESDNKKLKKQNEYLQKTIDQLKSDTLAQQSIKKLEE